MKGNEINARSRSSAKWFFSFLYIDIDSLSHKDFLKLLLDLGELWNPHISPLPPSDSPDMRKEIKEYQDYLKRILDTILKRGTDGVVDAIPMNQQIKCVGGRIFLIPVKKKNTLLIEFISSLEPFSLDNIGKCERKDCGSYYLKTTRKEKHFCSNKCAWVVASRKRRAVDSKKKSENNHQSYVKRKKREVGPNVKVARKKRNGA